MLRTTGKIETVAKPRQEQADDGFIEMVGRRVRVFREAGRLSRRELSEGSGVSPRYLAQLESGEGNISIGLLKRVAKALGLKVEELVSENTELTSEIDTFASLYRKADATTRTKVMQILDPELPSAAKAERVCLVGLRGAGKSTLGNLVSEKTSLPFVELNKEIENTAGIPIGEIIALYGQEGYRQLEADTLEKITATKDRIILAVAGGIVTEAETYARVLNHFHTVWVKASPDEHMERVRAQGDMRPMADNPQAMVQLRQILSAREAEYAQADHQLDTSGKDILTCQRELGQLIAAVMNA